MLIVATHDTRPCVARARYRGSAPGKDLADGICSTRETAVPRRTRNRKPDAYAGITPP